MISPLAYVHPNAKLGENVEIEPFATVMDDVEIGDRTRICSHAVIQSCSRIGTDCVIHPGAVIGGVPQDLKFKGEYTLAIIGDRTVVRECATVNRGTASKGKTVVGNDCLIMAYCHVAHDCKLGNHIIMSNATQLAGEVVVDDWAVIGGGTLTHQFTHIGAHVMIQGGSRINKDIPPYVLAGREPICYVGLNSVGLRRRNFPAETVNDIQSIYRTIYLTGYNIKEAIEHVLEEINPSPVRDEIIDFIRNSERGVIRANF